MRAWTQDGSGAAPADVLLEGKDGAAPVPLGWRHFGTDSDLALNFQGLGRTALVTELLAHCRRDTADLAARRADAQRLTLAGRIGGLAAIVTYTTAADQIAVDLRCPETECHEPLQVTISLETLLEWSRQAERERWIRAALDGASFRVRRPTGEDQQAWQSHVYESAEAAERAMVATLIADAPVSPPASLLEVVDAALEAADPLTCFRVAAVCPTCERESDHDVDLEALLLASLQRAQRTVLFDVHRLAIRYGWSERDIAAMPAWRRQVYLDFSERREL